MNADAGFDTVDDFPVKGILRVDGKTVIFAGRPSAQEIHSRMSPACLVGVAGTGELYHIRRHGFPCGKRCGSRPCEYAQAHEHGHEQGQGLSQCFHRVTSLKWPQKSTPFPMCCGLCWLLSKKERPARFSSQPDVCLWKRGRSFLYTSRLPKYLLFLGCLGCLEGVRCGEGEPAQAAVPRKWAHFPLVSGLSL